MTQSNSTHTIIGATLPNIPWQDRPEGCSDVVWRFNANPVIPHNLLPISMSIHNSAVVPFNGGFAGVFRCDTKERKLQLHSGKSQDAITWTLQPERIHFVPDNPAVKELGDFNYGYDPRVHWLEDRYYITWCNGYHGPTIGIGYTYDFETFYQLENAYVPFNRNGVLFPRKINGRYAMLNRPSDSGHTRFGSIFYSESPDMKYWGGHRWVMDPTNGGWQRTKIGPGPVPIESTEGWLMLYHGVFETCNGLMYSMGAALLDLDRPWKVLARTSPYLLTPDESYECVGRVPNVVFPCAALTDADTERMAIYYGGADTVTCLAFAYVDEIIAFTKSHSLI